MITTTTIEVLNGVELAACTTRTSKTPYLIKLYAKENGDVLSMSPQSLHNAFCPIPTSIW
jgi:hypothetical protein